MPISSSTRTGTSVAICIPTFRRAELLGRLLDSLTRLQRVDADVVVIVVDNDADRSALATVDSFRRRLRELVYDVEPNAGVAAARNRLVTLALERQCDLVAFVDDDEWVDGAWLYRLLETARGFSADAVLGPVIPSYEANIPEWLRRGGFFERPRERTGTIMHRGRTGNALVAARLLKSCTEPFPRCLRIGEDTYFFENARRRGASIVWCDEALAYEGVPSDRARVGWLLARAFEQGKTYSQCLRLLGQTRRQRVARTAKCLLRLMQATVVALPAVFMGRAVFLRAARRAAGAIGGLAGVCRTVECTEITQSRAAANPTRH